MELPARHTFSGLRSRWASPSKSIACRTHIRTHSHTHTHTQWTNGGRMVDEWWTNGGPRRPPPIGTQHTQEVSTWSKTNLPRLISTPTSATRLLPTRCLLALCSLQSLREQLRTTANTCEHLRTPANTWSYPLPHLRVEQPCVNAHTTITTTTVTVHMH